MNSFHRLSVIDARRALRGVRPATADELHGYCRAVLGFDVPRVARTPGGFSAPFDYLRHAFFENERPRDCVVWANRGGGKTRLGAIATLLDLVFKPGIEIRILGGSLEQSSKMHAYLREMLERDEFADLLDGKATGKRIELANGSRVEVLAQSEQSVRGVRVQKIRCDEVELFTPEVWQAIQFTTRSAWCGDVFVPGCIEVLSTMHRPYGLMSRLVREDCRDGADDAGFGRDFGEAAATTTWGMPPAARRLFHWGLLDVLEHCRPQRECERCGLNEDCRGRAKRSRGFLAIDDALQQRDRSAPEAWQAEMLCLTPNRSDCVYSAFDPATHVRAIADGVPAAGREPASGSCDAGKGASAEANANAKAKAIWVGGMDFGFRAPTVVLWACHDPRCDVLHVVDEHVAAERTIEQHVEAMRAKPWPAPAWIGIDPAGHQRHEHTGVSTATLLSRAGFRLRARRLELRAGIEAVRARLKSASGRVRLFVDPRCEHLIEALRTYHFPPDRPHDDVEPVKDGADHVCDALRYLVINLDDDARDPVRVKGY